MSMSNQYISLYDKNRTRVDCRECVSMWPDGCAEFHITSNSYTNITAECSGCGLRQEFTRVPVTLFPKFGIDPQKLPRHSIVIDAPA